MYSQTDYNKMVEDSFDRERNGFSIREEFPINLYNYAKMYAKSQADLCAETGIPKSTMSQYFSGARFPRPEHMSKLAGCFNVSVGQLMGTLRADEEKVDDLPIELRVIARRGLRLSPEQRSSLLRYCMYAFPEAFTAGEDDLDEEDLG